MKLFRKHRKLGNQGLSLVELLCSLAILGMLTMVVSSVLVVSANGYRHGNAETGAQQEAQLVANQITDLLIDTSAHGVEPQVHFVEATRTLTITQENIGYEVVQVGTELLFSRYELDAAGTRINQTERQLMAENLRENSFFVDDSAFAETGNVSVEMVYMKGAEEYPAAFNVTARNKEKTPETVPTVELKVPTEIIQEPGQDFYKIKANVTGSAGTVTYTYECEGNTDENTKVESDGTVKVGQYETANMFRVKVTATVSGPAGTTDKVKFVRVYVRRVTTVSLTGNLEAGVNCQNGARYLMNYSVDGNNMAKAVGTDYDDPTNLSDPNIARNLYVDPYRVDWTVSSTGSTATHLGVDATTGRVVLVLNGDMADGEEITVTARAIHPRGANKSEKNYFPGAEAKWVLRKSASPFTLGNGWLRQTDREQAAIDGTKMGKLKQDNGVQNGGVHKIQVRFRAINPDGSYGSYHGWLGNEYNSDGDNSNSINLRPLMFGALDYSKDYEMEIRIGIFASNVTGTPEYVWGQRVWPTAGTPENEYYIKHVVNRVGLIFKGDYLGFGESLMIDEASALTVNMKKDQEYTMMNCVGVQGIEPDRIKNEMRFLLEKKNAAGEWVEATGEGVQNVNGTLKIIFRSNNFAGNYRVKVWAEGMKNYVLNGYDYREDGTENWKLWDDETGHNIFYFNVNQIN